MSDAARLTDEEIALLRDGHYMGMSFDPPILCTSAVRHPGCYVCALLAAAAREAGWRAAFAAVTEALARLLGTTRTINDDEPSERSIPTSHHVGDLRQARAALARAEPLLTHEKETT